MREELLDLDKTSVNRSWTGCEQGDTMIWRG